MDKLPGAHFYKHWLSKKKGINLTLIQYTHHCRNFTNAKLNWCISGWCKYVSIVWVYVTRGLMSGGGGGTGSRVRIITYKLNFLSVYLFDCLFVAEGR